MLPSLYSRLQARQAITLDLRLEDINSGTGTTLGFKKYASQVQGKIEYVNEVCAPTYE
jgi:hypothetical protein